MWVVMLAGEGVEGGPLAKPGVNQFTVPPPLTSVGLFGKRLHPLALECGNCGKGVAAGLSTCPECGVAFEQDIAKCSHCASWIPVNASSCPKCKSEFRSAYRSQWQLRNSERRILLPKVASADELERKVLERLATTPRIVEESGGAPLEGDLRCPNCSSTLFVTVGEMHRCRMCKTDF